MIIGEQVVDTPKRTELKILVLDEGNATEIVNQYGMRYPDGKIRWTSDGQFGYSFQQIAEGNDTALRGWEGFLTKAARQANIDPQGYIESHVPVKRTVILVTTAPEEIHA